MKLFKKAFIIKFTHFLSTLTIITIASLFNLSHQVYAQEAASWIVSDSSWKYSDTFISTWETKDFDDTAWDTVAAPSGGRCGPNNSPDTPSEIINNGGSDIWSKNPSEFQTAYFRKTFTLDTFQKVEVIRGGFDDDGELYVNGTKVYNDSSGTATAFGPIDITQYLKQGKNVISARVTDTAGGCQRFALGVKIENASSQINIIKNGSFEIPVINDSSIDTYLPGQIFGEWLVVSESSGSVEHIPGSRWNAADGLQSVDLNASDLPDLDGSNPSATGKPGIISQSLNTTKGEQYTIKFAISGNPEGPPLKKDLEVWWDSTLLDTVSFDVTGISVTNMGWAYHSYTATAVNDVTTLKFKSITSGNYGPVIDDVSVESKINTGKKFVYVALGDSYQSGEGAGNSLSITNEYLKAYENGSNYLQPDGQQSNTYTSNALAGGDGCHRSLANYAKINRKKLRPDLTDNDIVLIDVTCSGATIEPSDDGKHTVVGKTGSSSYDDPDSQIAIALKKLGSIKKPDSTGMTADDVDLITVGMGGNDAKFADLVKACLTPNLVRRVLEDYSIGNALQRWVVMKYYGIDSCEQAINKNFTDVIPNLDTLAVKEIAAQSKILKTFPNARLLQLNYPSIIPKTNPEKSWCSGIDKKDFNYARSIAHRMDSIINESVRMSASNNPRIEVVDIESAFGDDPLCSDNLANGLSEENFSTEISRLISDPVVNPMLKKLLDDVNLDLACRRRLGIGCDTGTIDEQIANDTEKLKGYFKSPINQQTIFANMASRPIPGGEEEGIRYDRSRGLFHPNANGFAVIACHVLAAFKHTGTENCFSAKSPVKDLINGEIIKNTPVNAKAGDQVHIQFSGFARNVPIHTAFYSTPVDLGTFISDDSGVVDTIITLPNVGAGVHTLELQGNTEGGVGVHKRVRINYPGRPLANDVYVTYICGFNPSTETNLQSEQIDILYLGEMLETLSPDEEGCVWADIPLFDTLKQSGVITITARSQTSGKEVKTTIDPIPSIVGLWAESSKPQALSVIGSNANITGLVHSNADIIVRGSKNTFTGGVEYVTNMTVTGVQNKLPSARKIEEDGKPLIFKIADYQPGGIQANSAGSNYHAIPKSACVKGVWNMLASKIPNGIVYVPCAVVISGSNATIKATIVAEGSIQLKGASLVVGPGVSGAPALITQATNSNAIRIDGANIKIDGTIQALKGETRITGTRGRYHCGIVAQTIIITGSDINVPIDDQCVPQ